MEEEIAKDPLDERTRKAKERSDHFIAETIEKNEREGDPRLEKEPIEKEDVPDIDPSTTGSRGGHGC